MNQIPRYAWEPSGNDSGDVKSAIASFVLHARQCPARRRYIMIIRATYTFLPWPAACGICICIFDIHVDAVITDWLSARYKILPRCIRSVGANKHLAQGTTRLEIVAIDVTYCCAYRSPTDALPLLPLLATILKLQQAPYC
ncbi:hypothetical protein B0H11DRAFT_2251746 [Mycena galericulata]|nr:hypothetical protein B0H11DRAFT_2251746 [Mycena galericulata]